MDSYGLMALVTDRASAAELLRVGESDEVRLRRLGDDDEDPDDERSSVTTTVTLGRSRSAT